MWDRLTSLFDEGALEPELLRLIDGGQAGGAATIVAVLIAAGIGVVHAIGPGHGKALIGAYLAGTRGRPRDAVALGLLVAAMHTASVIALGVVLQATQRVPDAPWLEPALMLTSAVAVTAVGITLVVRHHRDRCSSGVHAHEHDGHAGHLHALPDGVPPLSRSGIVALATSGGLLPSPAAFLVLATAIAVGRTGFGVALVAAFGVGLAVTLTGVGLAVLWGRARLDRRAGGGSSSWVTALAGAVPLVAAWFVVGGGLLLATGAVLRW